jgi:hypothetical protein
VGAAPNSIGVVLSAQRAPATSLDITSARAVLITARVDPQHFVAALMRGTVRVWRSTSSAALLDSALAVPRHRNAGTLDNLSNIVLREPETVSEYLSDTVEALARAGRGGHKVAEVEVSMRPRFSGISSASTLGSMWYVLRVMAALRVQSYRPSGRRVVEHTQWERWTA